MKKDRLVTPQTNLERKELVEWLYDCSLWANPEEGIPDLQACIYWWVGWVDPKTELMDLLNPEKNTEPLIYLEASPWTATSEGWVQEHDLDLDCRGYSLVDCLVDLSVLVRAKYGTNLLSSRVVSSQDSP